MSAQRGAEFPEGPDLRITATFPRPTFPPPRSHGPRRSSVTPYRLLDSESHCTVPVVALVDSLDADEVKVVNRLMQPGIVILLSKPVKTECLEELFSRYGEKRG